MTEHETNVAVREWLNSLPGLIQADTPAEVTRKGWAIFGRGNLEMFRAALAIHGFKPESLGNTFILRLPSRPIAGADPERHRRLYNLTG